VTSLEQRNGKAVSEPRITLVGRAGCHLCDEARDVVADVAAKAGATWVEVSVDDDPELGRRYADDVPVVLVDGRRHAYWHVDPGRLLDALAPSGRRRRRWFGIRATGPETGPDTGAESGPDTG
jgi:hypothetical protein